MGNISQKINNPNVTSQVAIQTALASAIQRPEDLAIHIAIEVASEAVKVFTKLFQIRIVIRSLSVLLLICFNDLVQYFFSFNKELIL
ncbi:MAG: hypothetical protein LBQ59_00200 [Candidatus Peribacteria bacterium]|nr:hypothetical protein [Candidatus Peribacteria bacterium]